MTKQVLRELNSESIDRMFPWLKANPGIDNQVFIDTLLSKLTSEVKVSLKFLLNRSFSV